MANQVNTNLIYYIKATDLPVRTGMPTGGYFIYSDGDLIRRISASDIVQNIIQSTFEVITPSTNVPNDGYWRFRVLEPNTFNNVSPSITVSQNEIDDNWVYIVVNNGVASKELESKPDNSSQIKDWDSSEELKHPSVRIKGGVIYRVKSGETVTGSDLPENSSKWEEIVIDTISLENNFDNLALSVGDLNNLQTNDASSLVAAINEVFNNIVDSGLAPTLQNVLAQENIAYIPILGSEYFSNKGKNDFAQMKDLELYISDLRVVKRPSNQVETAIQTYDFCEGWVSENLFVNGLWKGRDNPSLTQLQDTSNWSNFSEIEFI